MAPRQLIRFALAALALVALACAAGCSKQAASTFPLFLNQRPTIQFTAAPVTSADTAYYVYEMYWSGYDADGRVDHFDYAIDPRGGASPETVWVTTKRSSETIHFSIRQTDSTSGATAASPHTFVVRAVDDRGARSALVSRSFFSYTMAPLVWMTSPANPNPAPADFSIVTGPDVRMSWQGHDPDAISHHSPVKYRWHLATSGDPVWAQVSPYYDPAEMRRLYAATNFVGWDSTSHDTTFVELRDLTPGRAYLFIVVAVDEAGAYTADWSPWTNILPFRAEGRDWVAPVISIASASMQYSWPGPVQDPFDPLGWVKVEEPATSPLTYHWSARPYGNYQVAGYRWMVDGNIPDETPRTNEVTDTQHWSAWNLASTSATFGPLPAGRHFFYLQAKDDHGNQSTGVVQIESVQLTFDRELLVVDDTRLEVDRFSGATRLNYTKAWPAAAELDTFLYAVGNVPWRSPASGRAGVSPPGLFAGYSFDTIGTRSGYEIPTSALPLSKLARFRHVLWMTDGIAGANLNSPTDVINGMSLMRWMCTPGRQDLLGAYAAAGGEVWFAGGAGAYASLIEFNATGQRNNDPEYGPGPKVFSSAAGELGPGRIMYDGAHWRSEMVCYQVLTVPTKSARAIGGWSHTGWGGRNVQAPDYSALPPTLRRRSSTLGDSLPPTRPNTSGQRSLYYSQGAFACEYLTRPNAIVEDFDPDAIVVDERSALDSLYQFAGGSLATDLTGEAPVSMTYYHGLERPKFVFTGFPLWEWTRDDCQGLVDFVLQRIWGMSRTGGASSRARTSTASPPGTASPPVSRR